MRDYEGPWIVPALESAGFDPGTVDAVAVSHLHYDHAGGVLCATGELAFPRARIVAQLAEWEIAMGENPRLVAGYDQPELRLVRDLGITRPRGRRGRDPARRHRHPHRRPFGRAPGRRDPRRRHARWPSSATCACGPGAPTRAGSPPSTISRSTRSWPRCRCSPGRPTRAGRSSCRTSRCTRSGRLVRDRDRYRFEALVSAIPPNRLRCRGRDAVTSRRAPVAQWNRAPPS